MCMSSPKMPDPAPPAPVAPPVVATMASAVPRSNVLSANSGRSALRIDRTQPGTGSSGSGLNIPT